MGGRVLVRNTAGDEGALTIDADPAGGTGVAILAIESRNDSLSCHTSPAVSLLDGAGPVAIGDEACVGMDFGSERTTDSGTDLVFGRSGQNAAGSSGQNGHGIGLHGELLILVMLRGLLIF